MMQQILLERLAPCPLQDEPAIAAVAIDHFPCVVGRHRRCDRSIDDAAISRRHCTFFVRGDEVCVHDLGSLNGTKLNGQRLDHPRPLRDGDVLTLARLAFQVHMT
jgi:pSer/pThr/pTyr-binding forkhead associated (FHA) protein